MVLRPGLLAGLALHAAGASLQHEGAGSPEHDDGGSPPGSPGRVRVVQDDEARDSGGRVEGARAVELRLNASAPLALTAPNFLGANIDTASLYQGTEPHRLDFSDPGLLALGRAFAVAGEGPSTLRIGGSTADDAGWGAGAASPGNPRQPSPGNGPRGSQRVVIDEAYWDEICRFVSSTGFELAWDLNALRMRTPANEWNTSNAEAQLKYVAARPAQAGLLKAVQLGNEPGHSMVETPGAPTPEQHGADFLQLRELLGRTFAHEPSSAPLIQGPDVCFGLGFFGPSGGDKCANLTYFQRLLTAAQVSPGTSAIDQITVHNYELSGPSWNGSTYIPHGCTLENLLNPAAWEEKMTSVLAGWRRVQLAVAPRSKLILSETATTGDGGCVNASNTFAAGFSWVHQLGLVSRLGYWHAYRQDLVGFSGIGGGSSCK